MGQQQLEILAHELREALGAGAFAHRGRVALSDGVTVDPERMARIVLADLKRISRGGHNSWVTPGEEQALYDDLLCLVALAREMVRA